MEEPFSLEIQSPEIVKVRKVRKPRKPRAERLPRKPRKPRAERAPRKPRVKKIKLKKKVNRRIIINRFVSLPKKTTALFWKKEYTILRQLEKKYGYNFLSEYVPTKKVESLAVYHSDWMGGELEIKRNEFYYQPQQSEMFTLTDKVGEDFNIKPKQTLKEFLL